MSHVYAFDTLNSEGEWITRYFTTLIAAATARRLSIRFGGTTSDIRFEGGTNAG